MNVAARLAVLSLSMSFLAVVPALAAGSGSSSSGGSSNDTIVPDSTPSAGSTTQLTPSPKNLKCKRNDQVLKLLTIDGEKKWKCVKQTSGLLSDDELYEQGRVLAKEGEYEWALNVFSSIKNQSDPKVLNYIGYANRKAGRLETGFAYYKKALAIDPNFVLAREYYGEGLVAAGRVDLAQIQLDEIAKRCGTHCSEYKELAKVMATAVN
jgi:tetratricopeptide (TPR) repeat protein